MPKAKIESESARLAREARVNATREAERIAHRAVQEKLQEVEHERSHDHVGRERAEIARKRAYREAHPELAPDADYNPGPGYERLGESWVYTANLTYAISPTPGVCCMCGSTPGYTKKPTWSVGSGLAQKRSFCRVCMRCTYDREPRDLNRDGSFNR